MQMLTRVLSSDSLVKCKGFAGSLLGTYLAGNLSCCELILPRTLVWVTELAKDKVVLGCYLACMSMSRISKKPKTKS
jgi:hypothetical protein